MSTINAQNYGDGTDSVPASAVLEGTVKAWIFYGLNGSDLESYNIASTTDNGTGDYDFSFSSAMNTSNYACTANNRGQLAVPSNTGVRIEQQLTTSFGALNAEDGSVSDESGYLMVIGDLA